MHIVKKTRYEYAGKEYDNFADAKAAKEKAEDKIVDFLNANREHLGKTGFWVIKDEGPIDFGASGGRRVLAHVNGKFENAVRYAFALPGFYGYGPGVVEPIIPVEVTDV